ncbi:MAG: hypothetical protein NZ739_00865 [Verrucomicrobiae bacterium]|nr:hypothetical protein [Verrucomicrobiae bacterium]MCX7722870.1 hypothetical protein [Verrucomicrobiae bacterium]
MKKLLKWAVRIAFVLVALVAVALVFRDRILKNVLEKQIHAQTGMRATIGSVYTGIHEPVVKIESLRIYNPPGFDDSRFVDIPEIYVEYDRAALLARKLRLRLVRFHLAELNVVENLQGKDNVTYLLEKQKAAKKRPEKGGAPAFEFAGIDTLKLRLDQARFRSLKNPRRNKDIRLEINEELKNVKSAEDFTGLIVQVMLKRGADFLSLGVDAAAEAARAAVEDAGGAVEKTTKKLLDTITTPLKKKD